MQGFLRNLLIDVDLKAICNNWAALTEECCKLRERTNTTFSGSESMSEMQIKTLTIEIHRSGIKYRVVTFYPQYSL